MASPSTRVLLRMLEPWLARARVSMDISLNAFVSASHIKRDLWITWNLPEDGKFAIEDAETMELLELFARVDYEAAWRTILDMANNAVHLKQVVDSAVAGDALYPRYKIVGLHRAFEKSTLKDTTRWLLFSTDPEEYSPTYYSVRQMLLQCWADRHHQGRVAPFSRGPSDRIQVQLHLDLSALKPQEAKRMLEDMIVIARLIRYPYRLELYGEWKRSPGQRVAKSSGVFTLDSLYLKLDPIKASDAMLRSIQSFWETYGVRVQGVELSAFTSEATVQVSRDFFQSALLQDAHNLAPARLDLCRDVTVDAFVAACSAIVSSPTLKNVGFDLPDESEGRSSPDHALFWPWIAYAVFSADATHVLDRIDLYVGNLRREDVETFENVLKARDPLAYIGTHDLIEMSSDDKDTRSLAVVEVQPNATLLDSRRNVELKTENRVETLRVVHKTPDLVHVAVMYPGAGLCFVHPSEIIQRREITRPYSVRRLSSLTLGVRGPTALHELTRLLKLIGVGIKELTILGDCAVFLHDSFFTLLFAACPDLRRLSLDMVDVESFSWLESVGSRLRSLSVSSVMSRERRGHKQLLAIVGGATAEVTDLHIQDQADTLKQLTDAIVRTLKANRSLERLLLSVETNDPEAQVVPAVAQRLEELDGSLLDGPAAPLPLKNKLAFLSVLSNQPTRDIRQDDDLVKHELGAAAQLDSILTSAIFRFAASRKQRVCGFVPTIAR